jgi:hypothetical protein
MALDALFGECGAAFDLVVLVTWRKEISSVLLWRPRSCGDGHARLYTPAAEVSLTANSRRMVSLLLLGLLLPALLVKAQVPQTPQDVVKLMITNENEAAAKHEHYLYMSNERSDRTGGHLWTEKVIETAPGRIRLLLAIDGKPLPTDRMQQERARVQQIHDHPDSFVRHERGTRVEEKRFRDMMDVLPHDFIFENVVLDNGQWRMTFRPNPNYKPDKLEERVLHNMAGKLVIDARDYRLIHMDFTLVQDVSIGFGLVADLHAGSTFITDRQQIDGRWHTMHLATVVHAKAAIFKSVDLNIDVYRSEFQPLDHDYSVPDAVNLLLR